MKILDTNIVIYMQSGQLKFPLPKESYGISVMTEIELLSFAELTKGQENWIKQFICNINVFQLDERIKERTIFIRKRNNIKSPDAIIAATAMEQDCELITNDKKLIQLDELKTLSLEVNYKYDA